MRSAASSAYAENRGHPVADAAVQLVSPVSRPLHPRRVPVTGSGDGSRCRPPTGRVDAPADGSRTARNDLAMTGRCKRSGGRPRTFVGRRWLPSVVVAEPATRGVGPAGALATEEPLDHDQANPARPDPRGLARRCRRRVQHAGRLHQPHDRPVKAGHAPVRLGHAAVFRADRFAKRLVNAAQGETPRVFGPGAFRRSGSPRPELSGRGIPCNARATPQPGITWLLQRAGMNAANRLRRRREENLRRRGDRGPWPVRDPSRTGRQAMRRWARRRRRRRRICLSGASPGATDDGVRLTDGCNEDRPRRCRSARIVTRRSPRSRSGVENRTDGMEVLTP